MLAVGLRGLLVGLTLGASHGRTENVVISRVTGNDAVVIRSTGEAYHIHRGPGCTSLENHIGKTALIFSPGPFAGVGSRLVIQDAGEDCRILSANPLQAGAADSPGRRHYSPSPVLQPAQNPSAGPGSAIEVALRLVGLDPGPVDGLLDEQTSRAVGVYMAGREMEPTDVGLAFFFTSLAADVMRKHPENPEAFGTALALVELAASALQQHRAPVAAVPSAVYQSARCVEGHWVQQVMSSGEFLQLEDGSLWQVALLDRIHTFLWLPVDRVLICGSQLVNQRTGKAVEVTRLK